jgi:hypothetical protein
MLAERERYEHMLSVPKAHGFVSHDSGTCGLHVHVDRKFFPDEERGIKRLLFLTEKFYPEIFIFSRRHASKAEEWSKRYMPALEGALLTSKDAETVYTKATSGHDRYRMVNLQKAPTIEFRIFRGTLNPTTFWATLQLVTNIVKLARNAEDSILDAITWLDIVNYEKYPELSEYNERRVGAGWSGETKIKAAVSQDAKEIMEEIEMPNNAIARSKLLGVSLYKLRGTSPVLISLWPAIAPSLVSSGSFVIEARRVGTTLIVKRTPEARFALQGNEIMRTDIGEPSPLSWIRIDEGFIANLQPELRDKLIADAIEHKEAILDLNGKE